MFTTYGLHYQYDEGGAPLIPDVEDFNPKAKRRFHSQTSHSLDVRY